jgi:hypothetical protein
LLVQGTCSATLRGSRWKSSAGARNRLVKATGSYRENLQQQEHNRNHRLIHRLEVQRGGKEQAGEGHRLVQGEPAAAGHNKQLHID